jgi:hypothetical protein
MRLALAAQRTSHRAIAFTVLIVKGNTLWNPIAVYLLTLGYLQLEERHNLASVCN